MGDVTKLFMESGIIVLTAFIFPFREDRARVREIVEANEFLEIYCGASIAVCEERDVKGVYNKARSGKISEFTGISYSI